MQEITLSVVLAVYNEGKTLFECLESVKQIADEIVLVDGGSSDETLEIGKKFGTKIIQTDNPQIFHINKQKALDAAVGKWILQLDADERVTPLLAKQILKVISGEKVFLTNKQQKLFKRHQENLELRDGKIGSNQGETVAYFIPRLNFFLGGFLRHGGVYPDGVIRLVKNGQAKFPCKNVHEQMEVNGKVEWLSENLLHMSDPTFQRYLERSNRYTSLTAVEMKKENMPINVLNMVQYVFLKPFLTWSSLFIRHKGFLDGFPGFVFALFSGLHHTTSYLKYMELSRGK